MKKMLAVLAVFIVVTGCFSLCSVTYASPDTIESDFNDPPSRIFSVVPNINISEAGTILVQISWSAPQITLVRRTNSVGTGYYALQQDVKTKFSVTNNSRKSVNSSYNFDGRIRVKAIMQGDDAKRDNIIVSMTNDNTTPVIVNLNDSYNGFELTYSNRQNGGDFEKLLIADQSVSDIQLNMTVKVKFEISAVD